MGISTHILNTALGRPAAKVAVTLEYQHREAWTDVATGATDGDGRWKLNVLEDDAILKGIYRLRFATGDYFTALDVTGLYPYVEIVFEVRKPAEHHHIPLLLTPNSYTTYRGS